MLLAFFIGFSPSVVRVLIMTTILSCADLLERDRVNDVYLLLLTALLMLLFNFYYIHNVAFLLSFLSLGGILTYTKQMSEKLKKLPAKIRELVSVTICANVFTLPVMIYYFRGLPLLNVVANLVVVPVMSFIMIYGIVVILISLLSMKIGWFVGIPLDTVAWACVKFINFMGNIPFGYFETLSIEKYYICLYYLAIYLIRTGC